MHRTVAICFAKTPGLTPAKTRLARDIGDARCLILYELMIARCRELMLQLKGVETYVAVNEAGAVGSHHWRDLSTYVQAQGALGEKLAHAEDFFFQRYSGIVFWGTDSPALTVNHFSLVQETLASRSALIVPALDGGFALYAASSKLSTGSWNKIHYSTSSTCRELQAQMSSDFVLAPALSDLDTVDDIPTVLQQMEKTPSQGIAWDDLKVFLRTL
jgi:glycosyltransferase A (GT-A) superfamily protein (DUF2064 family)